MVDSTGMYESQRMPRISDATGDATAYVSQQITTQPMPVVSQHVVRPNQPLTPIEREFFRNGDRMSAGEYVGNEDDHDAWRRPPKASVTRAIARSVVAAVTFPIRYPVSIPVGIMRRARERRIELEEDVARIAAALRHMSGPIPIDEG